MNCAERPTLRGREVVRGGPVGLTAPGRDACHFSRNKSFGCRSAPRHVVEKHPVDLVAPSPCSIDFIGQQSRRVGV